MFLPSLQHQLLSYEGPYMRNSPDTPLLNGQITIKYTYLYLWSI